MPKLAELTIEFVAKDVEEIKKKLEMIREHMEKLSAQATAVGNALRTAFVAGTAAITGYAAAGLRASSIGQVLGAQMEYLSRTIAGLFGPEVQKLSQWIQRLTEWLNSLSDTQKAVIARLVEFSAAFIAVQAVLPTIIAGFTGLVGVVGALITEVGILDALTGSIVPVLGAVIAGLGLWATTTESGTAALNALGKALEPIGKLLAGIWEVLEPVIDGFGKLAGEMMTALKPAFAAIGEVLGSVVNLLGEVVQLVVSTFAALNKLLGPGFITVIQTLAKILQDTLIPILKIVATIINGIAVGTAWLSASLRSVLGLPPEDDKKHKTAGNRGPVPGRIGGFEDVTSAYGRATTALLEAASLGKTSQQLQEDQLDETKKIRELIEDEKKSKWNTARFIALGF